MPCPTCNHTLQGIGETTDGRRHFWCPRCGTLRSESGKHADTEAPSIVARARILIDRWDGAGNRVDFGFWRDLSEAATGRPLL